MRTLVVALPQPSQAHLPADVPDPEVHVRQGDGGDILADGRHRVAGGGGGGGLAVRVKGVECFDLREEGGFAGIVEAEKEDGVFWEDAVSSHRQAPRGRQATVPSLLVA
jgi:hypothetical protein